MILARIRRKLVPLATAMAVLAGPVGPVHAQTALVSINIVDTPRPEDKWGYAPASRQVPVGTWVTWSNGGEDAHTVTSTELSFDSDILNPSEGFSWYFDTPGTYSYLCTLHTWMVGTVIVGDGVSPAPPSDVPAPEEAPVPEDAPAEG